MLGAQHQTPLQEISRGVPNTENYMIHPIHRDRPETMDSGFVLRISIQFGHPKDQMGAAEEDSASRVLVADLSLVSTKHMSHLWPYQRLSTPPFNNTTAPNVSTQRTLPGGNTIPGYSSPGVGILELDLYTFLIRNRGLRQGAETKNKLVNNPQINLLAHGICPCLTLVEPEPPPSRCTPQYHCMHRSRVYGA